MFKAWITVIFLLVAPSAFCDGVEIFAVGDVGFIGGNGVHRSAPSQFYEKSLHHMKDLLGDLNLVNLEGALVSDCNSWLGKKYRFSIDPESLGALIRWGVNGVAMANNHTLDCVSPNVMTNITKNIATATVAAGKPFHWHGVHQSLSNLISEIPVYENNGVSVAFISIKAWPGGRYSGLGSVSNRSRLFRAIRDLPVDVRVLSLHGGTENTRFPSTDMVQLAREFVTKYNGDLVLGHHSHVAQGGELIQKKNGRTGLILYSLGNFLHNGLSIRGDGLIAKLVVDKQGVRPDSLRLYPLLKASRDPTFTVGGRRQHFLRILQVSSATIGKRFPSAEHRLLPLDLDTNDHRSIRSSASNTDHASLGTPRRQPELVYPVSNPRP